MTFWVLYQRSALSFTHLIVHVNDSKGFWSLKYRPWEGACRGQGSCFWSCWRDSLSWPTYLYKYFIAVLQPIKPCAVSYAELSPGIAPNFNCRSIRIWSLPWTFLIYSLIRGCKDPSNSSSDSGYPSCSSVNSSLAQSNFGPFRWVCRNTSREDKKTWKMMPCHHQWYPS